MTGAKRKSEELGIAFLGDIPLHADICASADVGKPTMAASPDSPQAAAFINLAKVIATKLQL
jgi:ATP-binding protein involved in chromosome partitioning